MTGARLWRTVANYLRTPIGGACVVAAGVALALALLVVPAVDDGFRSQPAASQGTAPPAPTGVAVTPVPTIAKRAAVEPSVAPAVLMFRLATATPRIIVPPVPPATATPRPKVMPARPNATASPSRAKPTPTPAPAPKRNGADGANERSVAASKKPAVAAANPRDGSSGREEADDRGGRGNAGESKADRTRPGSARTASGETTRRSDRSADRDGGGDRTPATDRDRKPGDRDRGDRSESNDRSTARDSKANPKSGDDRRQPTPRAGANQDRAEPRTARQER